MDSITVVVMDTHFIDIVIPYGNDKPVEAILVLVKD
jgi:hypothetical protein